MPTHMLSSNEKNDLRIFVEMTVKTGLLPQEMVEKLNTDRLTKQDLSRIQRKIDGVIGGATLEIRPGTGRLVMESLMMAATAHRALTRIRVYDWK
ncbi:MAG: hypothetical protein PHS57_05905 [Alphaproteobacteria bacterium]|nr:hypothetical protein [Alphaproteobacteria bacterium]